MLPSTSFIFDDESEDNVDPFTPMTHGEYRILNKKLNHLLRYAGTFSTTNFENSVTSRQSIMQLMQALTSENAKTFEAQKKLVEKSIVKVESVMKHVDSTLLKVKTLATKVDGFLKNFQEKYDNQAITVTKMIEWFCDSLCKENESLYSLHFGIQKDNADLHTDVSSSIISLQNNLEGENKFMDVIAYKTQKINVLQEKLDKVTKDNASMNE
ncbi:unnamed protein product [Lactuca saligna]|uniref:Uncharacterized protein n=1 Tax=Lactuca saligna TaxID=75948 RepID=A0AA35YJX8_LACSI|nr:unnamed protein product [Lactuca saligna]